MGRTNSSAANNTAAFSQLQAENDALKKENRDLRQKLERMNELLLNAQRARFGSSSEKQDYVMPNQVGIFNEAEAEQDPKAPEPTEETILVPAHTRKPKRTMDELAAGLPVKEILITLPEEELICDVCGSKMAMIGKKLVSRRLEVIPRQCSLLEYYAVTYACKPCEEKTGYAHLVTTVTPPFLLSTVWHRPAQQRILWCGSMWTVCRWHARKRSGRAKELLCPAPPWPTGSFGRHRLG